MTVSAAVVVVDMDLTDMRTERIDPLREGKPGEYLKMTGVEAEAERRRRQGAEKVGQGGGFVFEDVFNEQQGVGELCSGGRNFMPCFQTVFQPGPAMFGETKGVLARVEDNGRGTERCGGGNGGFETLDCQGAEGRIDGAGTEIEKRGVDAHRQAASGEVGCQVGDISAGHPLQGAVVKVDFGIDAFFDEDGPVFNDEGERDVGVDPAKGPPFGRRGASGGPRIRVIGHMFCHCCATAAEFITSMVRWQCSLDFTVRFGYLFSFSV